MSKQQNALRLALEALRKARRKVLTTEECHAVIMSIKEALAEQKSGIKQVIELYDSPDQPSQQEPVACIGYWNQKTGAYYKPDQISASHQKLIEDGILRRCYTAPPQRTWVGLTESEITTSPPYSVTRDKGCFHAGALWAEAKLKEKNT